MKIFPIIKKVIVAAGRANFLGFINPAVRVAAIARMLVPQKPAVRINPVGRLIVPQKPAIRLAPLVSGVVKPFVDPAVRTIPVGRLLVPAKPAFRSTIRGPLMTVPEKPAAKIAQISIDLVHSSHVVTGSNDVGNVQNWSNPTNVQGAPNGSDATFAGAALILATGVLRGAMVAQSNRPTTLIIDEVYLDFYGQTQGLPVVDDLVSRLTLRYRINTSPLPGAETTLETIATANTDFHGTPKSFRINRLPPDQAKFTDGATAALSTDVTWANIALIQPNWQAAVILGATGVTYRADAVRLRVVAHEIWNP